MLQDSAETSRGMKAQVLAPEGGVLALLRFVGFKMDVVSVGEFSDY